MQELIHHEVVKGAPRTEQTNVENWKIISQGLFPHNYRHNPDHQNMIILARVLCQGVVHYTGGPCDHPC